MLQITVVTDHHGYLFAGELHEHVPHDALPLALQHPLLERVEEVEVLLDQEPQGAGEHTGGERRWLSEPLIPEQVTMSIKTIMGNTSSGIGKKSRLHSYLA